MSTRFYFSEADPAAVVPAFGQEWGDTSNVKPLAAVVHEPETELEAETDTNQRDQP